MTSQKAINSTRATLFFHCPTALAQNLRCEAEEAGELPVDYVGRLIETPILDQLADLPSLEVLESKARTLFAGSDKDWGWCFANCSSKLAERLNALARLSGLPTPSFIAVLVLEPLIDQMSEATALEH